MEYARDYLTFDDILIKPVASSIEPGESSVETFVARGFTCSLPILSASMDTVTDATMAIALGKLGGLGVIHRNCTLEEEVAMVAKTHEAGVSVAAACSPFDIERAKALVCAGADVISIDSAHGHNQHVIDGAKKIKDIIGEAKLLVGNIATKEAAEELVSFADGIKVGIGPGSICTTRIVSGVGVPQFSAIQEVVSITKSYGVPVIADGGMRNSGDIAKALAAGASAVMLGNLLAGTLEAPGVLVEKDGKQLKEYRGMGSRAVLLERKAQDRYLGKSEKVIPEGVSGLVPYTGRLKSVVDLLIGGIQVSMGYVGARTITEFQGRAEFIRVSSTALRENNPHSLFLITE